MEYIANKIGGYIEDVGLQNMVQGSIDNANAMLGAMRILEARYPHLYRHGCAQHNVEQISYLKIGIKWTDTKKDFLS